MPVDVPRSNRSAAPDRSYRVRQARITSGSDGLGLLRGLGLLSDAEERLDIAAELTDRFECFVERVDADDLNIVGV